MPDSLSADRIAQIALAIAAAAGIGYGATGTEADCTAWQQQLDAMRAAGESREIRDADLCQDMIERACR